MTMNLDSYRSSTEYREILRILQKSSAMTENFLWQSMSSGKNIIPIKNFEIDFVSREVVISFDPRAYLLNTELPVYVRLDYNTSVFKVTDYRPATGTLHFSFPREIKTQEYRNNPRFHFNSTQEKFVSLRPSISGSRTEGAEIKVKSVDISYLGVGLMISENNRKFIENNRILWITKLQEDSLPYPVLAEVVYISNEIDKSRKGREVKVGLKLSGVFPQEAFQSFIL